MWKRISRQEKGRNRLKARICVCRKWAPCNCGVPGEKTICYCNKVPKNNCSYQSRSDTMNNLSEDGLSIPSCISSLREDPDSSGSHTAKGLNLAQIFITHVTFGWFLNLSVPQFPYLWMGMKMILLLLELIVLFNGVDVCKAHRGTSSQVSPIRVCVKLNTFPQHSFVTTRFKPHLWEP